MIIWNHSLFSNFKYLYIIVSKLINSGSSESVVSKIKNNNIKAKKFIFCIEDFNL